MFPNLNENPRKSGLGGESLLKMPGKKSFWGEIENFRFCLGGTDPRWHYAWSQPFSKKSVNKNQDCTFSEYIRVYLFQVLDDLRIPSLYLIVSYIQVLCDFAEVRYV